MTNLKMSNISAPFLKSSATENTLRRRRRIRSDINVVTQTTDGAGYHRQTLLPTLEEHGDLSELEPPKVRRHTIIMNTSHRRLESSDNKQAGQWTPQTPAPRGMISFQHRANTQGMQA